MNNEGYKVYFLINSNPATIMTDPEVALLKLTLSLLLFITCCYNYQ